MVKGEKLIRLMRSWPRDAILTTEWLVGEGYSTSLLQQYSRLGWIQLVGKGAYRRGPRAQSEDAPFPLQNALPSLTWQGGVYALQALQLDWTRPVPPVLVAARSALELAGFSHFLNLSGKETLWLFVDPTYRVPSWFKNCAWGVSVRFHAPSLFSRDLKDSISQKNWGPFVTLYSCPERAIMELLELCPQVETLEHAKLMMEGLATLRPQVAQELLEACTSIKVKRLFLALTDLCNHAWRSELDEKKLDLGSGPRILAPDLGFHPRYRISVPKEEAS